MSQPIPIYVGDELELRKPHACGANHWLVLRTGADLRIECAACGRSLMLPRRKVERSLKRFLARGPRYEAERRKAEGAAEEPEA